MGAVAADPIDGHEYTKDDPERAENKESDGERNLLNRRAVVDGVRSFHQLVVVRNGEGVIHVRHCFRFDLSSRFLPEIWWEEEGMLEREWKS